MAFVPKSWANTPSTSTPISAAALADTENRLSAYTDSKFNLSGTDGAKPSAASVPGVLYLATDTNALYYSDGAVWHTVYGSRGATNIATSESRTNAAYGTLTTPDQVPNITLGANGLVRVWYQATWQESVADAARAVICLNGTPVVAQSSTGVIAACAAATNSGTINTNYSLIAWTGGMASRTSGATPSAADVTTGQVVGFIGTSSSACYDVNGTLANVTAAGGPCDIFVAAGTYTVSVQFKASSGTVTASNRKLWVQALSFA